MLMSNGLFSKQLQPISQAAFLKRTAKALDGGWQELDGHGAIEAELQAFVNGPHAATADEHVNFMVRQDFLQLRRCSSAEEWDGRVI